MRPAKFKRGLLNTLSMLIACAFVTYTLFEVEYIIRHFRHPEYLLKVLVFGVLGFWNIRQALLLFTEAARLRPQYPWVS